MGRTLVTNLFGGPGIGKSTTAAGLFSELKQRGISAEYATEYAKDRVWEEAFRTMDNQIYMFAKQHHRIWRVLGKVDVVITDSPMLLSLYYGADYSKTFHQLVLEEHNKTKSLNVLLKREKKYLQAGRVQTEEESKEIDKFLESMLKENKVSFFKHVAGAHTIKALANFIIEEYLNE